MGDERGQYSILHTPYRGTEYMYRVRRTRYILRTASKEAVELARVLPPSPPHLTPAKQNTATVHAGPGPEVNT